MKAYNHEEKYVQQKSLDAYLMLQDLCFLLALREMGFGAERLKRVMEYGRDIYKEYRNRYCTKKDLKDLYVDSPHILAMKEQLKNDGYDYDEEQRKLDVSKYRFHGNQFMEDKK